MRLCNNKSTNQGRRSSIVLIKEGFEHWETERRKDPLPAPNYIAPSIRSGSATQNSPTHLLPIKTLRSKWSLFENPGCKTKREKENKGNRNAKTYVQGDPIVTRQ